MRRFFLLAATIIIVSCQVVTPVQPQPAVTTNHPPVATWTAISPTPTSQPTATPTPVPESEFSVFLHPDGSLYVGDQVSIEVVAPGEVDLEKKNVRIQVEGVKEEHGLAGFGKHGIGGRVQATFNWIWNTGNLQPGEYEIIFSVEPGGPTWVEMVQLLPMVEVPHPEPAAKWESEMLECCEVHFISGTYFAKDLHENLELIQNQAQSAVRSMGVDFDQRIPITILSRVLGHGGFAANEIYVSHLEDSYAGNDLAQVLHHEMVHILDRRLGGDLRPSLLVEGLAVYLSRGHFKIEPLLSRAAALVELGWYLPLGELADSFYESQHEIGYLEGAALVEFLVNRYGWTAFNEFYRDIHPHPSDSQAAAIDAALQEHFSISLQQLEDLFMADLERRHINPDMRADLILSVDYYETVRRYQLMLDPSAYFLTAWLPEGEQMRERDIVADYLRMPADPQNLALGELLVEADQKIRAGNYLLAEKALWQVNQELDQLQDDVLTGTFDPGQGKRTVILLD